MSRLRVIAGAAFRRGEPSELHDLARAARSGDSAALEAMAAVLLAGVAREAPDLLAAEGVTVVPMAGHLAGTASGPAEGLARGLCIARPGWLEAPGPERLADAPAASVAGERDPAQEAATLRWPGVRGRGPVLLVDDVVRTGASLEAARLAAPARLRERLVAAVAFRAEG